MIDGEKRFHSLNFIILTGLVSCPEQIYLGWKHLFHEGHVYLFLMSNLTQTGHSTCTRCGTFASIHYVFLHSYHTSFLTSLYTSLLVSPAASLSLYPQCDQTFMRHGNSSKSSFTSPPRLFPELLPKRTVNHWLHKPLWVSTSYFLSSVSLSSVS